MQIDAGWKRDEAIGLRRYWNVLQRELWLILGCALAATVVAFSLALALPPVYSASATLLIEPSAPNVVSIEDVYGLESRTEQYYATQFEILSSRPLVEAVIAELSLLETSEYRASREPSPLSWRAWVPDFLAPASAAADPLHTAIEIYHDRLAIEPIEDTQLVRVRFESADPDVAADVANAHVRAYIESMLDAKLTVTAEAAGWMTKRLDEMRDSLLASEAELQAFREREQLVDIEAVRALPAAEIEEISTRLAEVRRVLAAREITYEQIREADTGKASLQSIQVILDDPGVRSFQDAFAVAQAQVAELGKRYGPLHPTMAEALAERDLAKANLDERRASIADRIRREYEAAQAEERTLTASLGRTRADDGLDGRKQSELVALERAVETNRQLYELLYHRVGETAVTSDLQTAQARVVESALAPLAPVRPRKAMFVGGAFVGMLVLGFFVAFVNDGLNNTLRCTLDVEEKLKRPMLAMLPLLSPRALKHVQGGVIEDPVYGEAIRTLRTSILLDSAERPHKVVLVTSAINGEGKSTVALNLAAAFAKTGRVLIIDADMRRPTIGRLLDLPRYDAGLSELITKAAPFKACLAKTKVQNLHVIRTGFIPNDPLELLAHRRLAKILRVLAQPYDHIVIDSPPILPVSDAAVLSKYADAVVFVARAEETPVPQIEAGLQLLERVDATITGIVLNQLDTRKARKYSDFGYGGYHESPTATT